MLNYAHTRRAGFFSNRTPKVTTESEFSPRLCETDHKTSNKHEMVSTLQSAATHLAEVMTNFKLRLNRKAKLKCPQNYKKKERKRSCAVKSSHCERKMELDFISCDYVMPDVDHRANF